MSAGHELRLTIFWIVHLVLLGLFGLELLFVLSVWLKARVSGLPADAPRFRKLAAVFRGVLALLLSRRVWVLLKILVKDGLVHQRLYRTSFRRWAVHISVFGSWLVLGLFSTLTGVAVEILPLLGMEPEAVASIPFFGHLFHADTWWVALLNEILGLVALAGMLLVIYRRYVQRDPQLRTLPADGIVIGLLTLIAFSGFPTETFRLLADYTTASGAFAPDPTMISLAKLPPTLHSVWGPQWGFVGYFGAWLLGFLGLRPGVWHVMHNLAFWVHFVVVTALLFYMPFSRFFHVIMSPVIVAYNTMAAREKLQAHGQAAPAALIATEKAGALR
jgi:hypothetical protein